MNDYPPHIASDQDKELWDRERREVFLSAKFREYTSEQALKNLLPSNYSVQKIESPSSIHWELYKVNEDGQKELIKKNGSIHHLLNQWQSKEIN